MIPSMRVLVAQEHELEVGSTVVKCVTRVHLNNGNMETKLTVSGNNAQGVKPRSTTRADTAMKNHAELLGYGIIAAIEREEQREPNNE